MPRGCTTYPHGPLQANPRHGKQIQINPDSRLAPWGWYALCSSFPFLILQQIWMTELRYSGLYIGPFEGVSRALCLLIGLLRWCCFGFILGTKGTTTAGPRRRGARVLNLTERRGPHKERHTLT